MDRRTTGFVLVLAVLVGLAVLPGPFDWANRIDPMILGLPFSMFWQFLLAVGIAGSLVAWYLVDARSGDLDIDIDAVDADLDDVPPGREEVR